MKKKKMRRLCDVYIEVEMTDGDYIHDTYKTRGNLNKLTKDKGIIGKLIKALIERDSTLPRL